MRLKGLVGALLIFLRPLPSVSLSNYGDDNGSTIRSMFRSLVWDLSQTIWSDGHISLYRSRSTRYDMALSQGSVLIIRAHQSAH